MTVTGSSLYSERPERYYNEKSLTKLNIVLDVDETLVHTPDDEGKDSDRDKLYDLENNHPRGIELRGRIIKVTSNDVGVKRGYGVKYNFPSILRPHLKEFLRFCFEYFRIVSIWSAGQRGYVHSIVRNIFRDIHDPSFVYTRDQLKSMYDGSYEKPLMYLREIDPLANKYFTPENTLILDDNYRTFAKVNPDNAIHIPAYIPEMNMESLMEDENSLLEFKDWLMQPKVMNTKDVRKLDKSNIFSRKSRF